MFKLSGLTAAEVNGMAASVSQAKTGALWDDASAWDRYEDARRRDASSPDSSPAGSPPPSAPPSPPGSDGYASTQAYDDGEREDEPPPSPPPPLPPPSPAPPLASLPPLVLGTPVTPPPRMRVDESETPHNSPSCETSPRRCIGFNMDGQGYYYYGRQSQWYVWGGW